EDGGVAIRARKASDEIERNMRPRSARDRQRPQEADWARSGALVLSTYRAGRDEGPCVTSERGPPETSLENR
ncbi:uncharacterized, partial [Tachysurus ichikawai]